MSITTCGRCGITLDPAASHCGRCGPGTSVSIRPDPAGAIVAGAGLGGVVIHGPDKATGDAIISVDDFRGTVSEARTSQAGAVVLSVRGSAGVGKENQAPVGRLLRQRLLENGVDVDISEGADEFGEDLIMKVGDRSLSVQITVVPGDGSFWRTASNAQASRECSIAEAVEWLRAAIVRKVGRTPRADRGRTVLVLDVKHIGVLATGHARQIYLNRYLCPASEHGFASVWIVGPIVEYCERLGSGSP